MSTHQWSPLNRYPPEAPRRDWRFIFQMFGVGALVAGGLTLALWIVAVAAVAAPLTFWFAWNVLELGPAIGFPLFGFWPIVLVSLFLVFGWFGKVLMVGVVFLSTPDWLVNERLLQMPEPTLRNFLAIALVAMLMARPHARAHRNDEQHRAR
jgi:hypothetical protein